MEDINDLIRQRLNKLEALKAKGIEPYGRRFEKSCSIKELVEDFQEGKEVSVAGRIMALRLHGKSAFLDLRDSAGKVQLYLKEDGVAGNFFKEIFPNLDIGDIIGVRGVLFKTRTGEVTVNVSQAMVLSKGLRPLPEKWHGLKDIELRYRQRYLDLVMNEETRKVFQIRSKVITFIRNYLDSLGYLEVETPMMQPIPGGAIARPFKTHHNALGIDLYLRIAPELYLKRLLVGGFDKVYEINRNFRNEGLSRKHNPEFTMLEAYASYCDYKDMMSLIEDMICSIAEELFGKREIPRGDTVINIEGPWDRISFYSSLKQATGIDFGGAKDIRKIARDIDIEIKPEDSDMDILNNIFENKVEPKLTCATFIVDYPAIFSPLAKRKQADSELVERFELYIAGQEIANAYSELNDPIEQRRRFEEVLEGRKEAVSDEKIDEDFLLALEYGMPPAGGLGVGIDRLIMVLTGQDSIRDVILFPQLKPEVG